MSQSEQLFKYLNGKKAFGYTVNDFSTLILVPYGGKLWRWENLVNSLQKHFGRRKIGKFVHSQTKNYENFVMLSGVAQA